MKTVEKLRYGLKNILSPVLTATVSIAITLFGGILMYYSPMKTGPAYIMIGLIGLILSHKSFKKSKYFSY